MNEQIKELYEQAYRDAGGFVGASEHMSKFAELIVRECANVAADHEALDIYEEIREHFGIDK